MLCFKLPDHFKEGSDRTEAAGMGMIVAATSAVVGLLELASMMFAMPPPMLPTPVPTGKDVQYQILVVGAFPAFRDK